MKLTLNEKLKQTLNDQMGNYPLVNMINYMSNTSKLRESPKVLTTTIYLKE